MGNYVTSEHGILPSVITVYPEMIVGTSSPDLVGGIMRL
jgi:hypothetical protein